MKRIELIPPSISASRDADDFGDGVYEQETVAADYIDMEFKKDSVVICTPAQVTSDYEVVDWGSEVIKLKPEEVHELKNAGKKDKQRLAQEIIEQNLIKTAEEGDIGLRTKRII